jgi:hypothetical protein
MVLTRKAIVWPLALAVALIAAYGASGGVPELRQPVRVVDSAFVADGGSLRVEIEAQDGRRFSIAASGSLDKPRSEFLIYTQRWLPYLPVPYLVMRGSKAEGELAHAIEIWSSSNSLTPEDRVALASVAALLAERKRASQAQ